MFFFCHSVYRHTLTHGFAHFHCLMPCVCVCGGGWTVGGQLNRWRTVEQMEDTYLDTQRHTDQDVPKNSEQRPNKIALRRTIQRTFNWMKTVADTKGQSCVTNIDWLQINDSGWPSKQSVWVEVIAWRLPCTSSCHPVWTTRLPCWWSNDDTNVDLFAGVQALKSLILISPHCVVWSLFFHEFQPVFFRIADHCITPSSGHCTTSGYGFRPRPSRVRPRPLPALYWIWSIVTACYIGYCN